jgi:Abnormal spindle-like microcephaly-assoc'd, ASPM-SPD-2-Hydin
MRITKCQVVASLLLSIIAVSPAAAAEHKLGIAPKSLSFGKVQVGTLSAPKTVTVSNPNSAPVSITSITPTGPYAVSANTCVSPLPAKPATCKVSVTFNPTSASKSKGTKEAGKLSITDEADKSPQVVKLTGR